MSQAEVSEGLWKLLSQRLQKNNPELVYEQRLLLELIMSPKVIGLSVQTFYLSVGDRDVLFTGSVFKPKSKLFAFFDNINVTKYITPDVPYVNYFTVLLLLQVLE